MTIGSMDDVRQWIAMVAAPLDPSSRYRSELEAIVESCETVAELEARLRRGCRGKRHAGSDVFEQMSLADKLRANLITAETALFRFAEGELEASRAVVAARHGEMTRVLIVPCSHGEEAFTMAAFLLGETALDGDDARAATFSITAFDIQRSLLAEARTGRLTFGYPVEHLEAPGYVGRDVLDRIDFRHGDAFALPLAASAVFDLVLCRNFIGYFVPERAAALTASLADRVAPGGRLFLDTFCLAKMPEVRGALAAAAMTQIDDHPVFARAAS